MNRLKRMAAAVLVLLLLVLWGAASASSFQTDTEGIGRVSKSVLLLKSYDGKDQLIGYGSGFVAFDGYTLATSYRILEGASWIMAVSEDGSEYLVTHVIAADEKKGIALLEFFSPTDLQPLDLATGEGIVKDALVTAIGSPQGDKNTVTLGSISGVYDKNGVSYLQFTSTASECSSGGALLDERGRVVGITLRPVDGGKSQSLAVNISGLISLKEANFDNQRLTIDGFFARPEETPFAFPLPDPGRLLAAEPTPGPGAALSVPRNVKAAFSDTGATVTWDWVMGAKEYNVYRSQKRDAGYELAGTASGTEYVDAAAADGVHYYKLASVRDVGVSDMSTAAESAPNYALNETLAVPKGVKAKAGQGGVALSWSAAANAQGYMVFRSNEKNGSYERVAVVADVRFADEGTVLGETYYYKVRSFTGREVSGLSAAASAKMPKPTPTLKPTPTPYIEPDYFVQVGMSGEWSKSKGYWRVNPKVTNSSKISTVDSFTITYWCVDNQGNFIINEKTGDYYAVFTYQKTIKPGKSVTAGFAWLEGYKDVAYISLAVTKIHTTDGRTITYPEDDWDYGTIDLQ